MLVVDVGEQAVDDAGESGGVKAKRNCSNSPSLQMEIDIPGVLSGLSQLNVDPFVGGCAAVRDRYLTRQACARIGSVRHDYVFHRSLSL